MSDVDGVKTHQRGEPRRPHGLVYGWGIVESPSLFLMGTQFLRHRKSALLNGADDDARDLSDHMVSYLGDQVITADS